MITNPRCQNPPIPPITSEPRSEIIRNEQETLGNGIRISISLPSDPRRDWLIDHNP